MISLEPQMNTSLKTLLKHECQDILIIGCFEELQEQQHGENHYWSDMTLEMERWLD